MISILYNAGIGFWREYDVVYRFHLGIGRLQLLPLLVLLGRRCIYLSAFDLDEVRVYVLTLLILCIEIIVRRFCPCVQFNLFRLFIIVQ
jgi:hypothetical protein